MQYLNQKHLQVTFYVFFSPLTLKRFYPFYCLICVDYLQGIIGAVSDHSKKSAAAPLSSSSRCDSAHPGSLSTSQQGEAKEEDVSRKDKASRTGQAFI